MNQTTPPVGPANTASQIVFTPDDSRVVAAIKGADANTPGYLAIWDVNTDGSLSQNVTLVYTPVNGGQPFSLTPVPGRNAFLSTDPVVGGVEVFDLDNGMATTLAIEEQIATCWSVYSERTDSYYVTDTVLNTLAEVSLDEALLPELVVRYQFEFGTGPLDLELASLPDNE